MQVEKYSLCVCVKTKSDVHSSMQNDISKQKEQKYTQVQTFNDHLAICCQSPSLRQLAYFQKCVQKHSQLKTKVR